MSFPVKRHYPGKDTWDSDVVLDLKVERRVSEITTGMARYHNSVKEMQTTGDCVKHYEIS